MNVHILALEHIRYWGAYQYRAAYRDGGLLMVQCQTKHVERQFSKRAENRASVRKMENSQYE